MIFAAARFVRAIAKNLYQMDVVRYLTSILTRAPGWMLPKSSVDKYTTPQKPPILEAFSNSYLASQGVLPDIPGLL